MGSSSSSVLLVWYLISCSTIIVALAGHGASMELKVGGDSQAWQQPPQNQTNFYNHWASINRFQVGDSIWFEYENDSVLVVDKYDYYHCNSATPTAAYGDGNTTVRLDEPGPVYFISGNLTHCMNGQRIIVQVMAIRPELYSPPSSSIANPPESYGAAAAPSPSVSASPGSSLLLSSPVVAAAVAIAAAAAYLII